MPKRKTICFYYLNRMVVENAGLSESELNFIFKKGLNRNAPVINVVLQGYAGRSGYPQKQIEGIDYAVI
jgi:hypothetical protein